VGAVVEEIVVVNGVPELDGPDEAEWLDTDFA
jgi:hypothetical protein